MGRIFYLMGKSSSGKDTVFEELCRMEALALKNVVPYTTRPIREKEVNGKEYFFVDDSRREQLECEGRIIEIREYQTIHGPWKYFTVDDENIDLERQDYIAIGTLESYAKIRKYYGKEKVIPIYIEVDDGIRLERALKRECKPQNRKFEEMCRRYLADTADYSEENLAKAEITRRFHNDGDRWECIQEIADFIHSCQKEKE